MKKIIILGGNGYIGQYLTSQLLNEYDVTVADISVETCTIDNIHYKKLDFINCTNFEDYVKDYDIIVHLICTLVPNEDYDSIVSDIQKNVVPSVLLFKEVKKHANKKVVFLSSGGTVYGEHSIAPINENEQTNPICNYGIIKLFTEKYLQMLAKDSFDYSIVRLANPYSDKVKNGKKQGIIPIIVDKALKGEEMTIFGDGNDVRDYIYMDDAIEAIAAIIKYNGSEQVFNVGTGVGSSINDLLFYIDNELGGVNIQKKYIASRTCDVKNNVLDITRIRRELNWEPKTDIREGISKIVNQKKMKM